MLVIRLQRTGRRGHAMFRVVVQDARRTPTSGKLVASLGSYDPHAKTVKLDVEKAAVYLKNGAQPSPRVAALLKGEGVKLPKWVAAPLKKSGAVRNPEKLQKAEKAAEPTPVEEIPAEAEVTEAPTEPEAETAPVETPTTEPGTAEASIEEVSEISTEPTAEPAAKPE